MHLKGHTTQDIFCLSIQEERTAVSRWNCKKLPFDGYLCGCGIYFTFDEEVIFEKHLDPERGDEIADYMTKCQIDGILREQKMCISLQEFQDLTDWKIPKKIHE